MATAVTETPSTISAVLTSATSTIGLTASSRPPLGPENIIPILLTTLSYLSWFISFAPRVLTFLTSKFLLYPLSILSEPILWVLSPLVVFGQVLVQIMVLWPLDAFKAFADVMYPLYVFCGVACLFGGTLGFGTRYVVKLASMWVEAWWGSGDEEGEASKVAVGMEEEVSPQGRERQRRSRESLKSPASRAIGKAPSSRRLSRRASSSAPASISASNKPRVKVEEPEPRRRDPLFDDD